MVLIGSESTDPARGAPRKSKRRLPFDCGLSLTSQFSDLSRLACRKVGRQRRRLAGFGASFVRFPLNFLFHAAGSRNRTHCMSSRLSHSASMNSYLGIIYPFSKVKEGYENLEHGRLLDFGL